MKSAPIVCQLDLTGSLEYYSDQKVRYKGMITLFINQSL